MIGSVGVRQADIAKQETKFSTGKRTLSNAKDGVRREESTHRR